MTLKNTPTIDVLVIDSHLFLHEGLKRILERDTDIRIVAEGENGKQLLSLYEQHRPDVVLIDVNFKQKNEVEALHELLHRFPFSKVLLFTVVEDFTSVAEAIKGGVSGYLLKEMDSTMMIHAIKLVVKGSYYIHPKITTDFLADVRKLAVREEPGNFLQKEVKRPYHVLTIRESEVLQLLTDGHSNKSIGELLDISSRTVSTHISSILRKMALQDRTQAVVTALKNGWVELR